MNTQIKNKDILTIGLAMFAMFFGSGNVIYPVLLGQYAGDKNPYAIAAMLLTAVLVPFVALTVMLLLQGNYRLFFGRIGRTPGMVAACFIMALIGPFAVMPRCVTVSYAALDLYFPNFSLFNFSIIASIIIFAFSIKKSKVVDLLGTLLTPLLLLSLAVIVVSGLLFSGSAPTLELTSESAFMHGLLEGYQTMDIFAALFFSAVIIPKFKSLLGPKLEEHKGELLRLAVKSSLVGMFLLGIIYLGMSFVASFFSVELAKIPEDQHLAAIAQMTLGPYAGIFANAAISLACLTTAITLAVVFTEFVRKEIFANKVGYVPLLALTTLITFLFSNLGFSGIKAFLVPVLVLIYPATLTLTLVTLLNQWFGFKYFKVPVYGVFLATVLITYWPF